MYIESYSILEDLKLILATFKIVFTKESTEGLEEGTDDQPERKGRGEKDVLIPRTKFCAGCRKKSGNGRHVLPLGARETI